METVLKDVWLNSDNSFVIRVNQKDAETGVSSPVDFSSTTKIELFLKRKEAQFTVTCLAADNPKTIDWTGFTGNGYLRFKLGEALADLNVPSNLTFVCELQVYDNQNPNGIVIVGHQNREFQIQVWADRQS